MKMVFVFVGGEQSRGEDVRVCIEWFEHVKRFKDKDEIEEELGAVQVVCAARKMDRDAQSSGRR